MTVASYYQTNYTTDTSTAWKSGVDGNWAVLTRLGVMFAPNEQTVPDMTVRLQAGHVFNGVTLTEVAAQNTGTITAPVTNPRIDRVVIDNITGAVSVVTGTPAGSPVAPAIPAGKCPVAQIALTSSTTEIANSIITDERDFSGLGGQGAQPPYGVSTNSGNNYSVTTSPPFASLTTGREIFVKINAVNTGSVTIDPNGIGATNVRDNFGNTIPSGTFVANSVYQFIYDGTNLIMINETRPYRYLPWSAETGVSSAYIVTPAPAISALSTGIVALMKPTNNSTGACTLQVGSTANIAAIKLMDGTDPTAGAMLTTGMYFLPFDGTNFVLTNPSTPAVSGASQSDQETGTSSSKFVSPLVQQYHPSAAKAWASFSGSGAATLVASYNITSASRGGSGDYTLTIAADFSSSAWSALFSASGTSGGAQLIAMSAGSVQCLTRSGVSGAADQSVINFAGFGDQ